MNELFSGWGWDLLSAIADGLGIATVLVAIPTALNFLFWEPKRRRKVENIIRNPSGGKSAVLAVGIGKKAAMESQVKAFLAAKPALMEQLGGTLTDGENFFLLERREDMPEPEPGEEDFHSVRADKFLDDTVKELERIMIGMAENGVSKIHLFYQGPAVLMAPIGAALSNRFTVVCYHYSRNVGYYSVGLMQGA